MGTLGLEAALVRAAIWGSERLGPVAASDLGGAVGRWLGPWLPTTRVAEANLRRALPELDRGARRRVIRAVWDNLGRTALELPHLGALRPTAAGPGWEMAGREHLTGAPVLFISGHLGNWEMLMVIAAQLGLPVGGVYRAASNPRVDASITGLRRRALGSTPLFPKGAAGARGVLRHLAGGGSLGLLVDQKMNDGIAVPLFGRPAMTASAAAQFALRFRIPVLPARIVRLGPARFRMVVDPPLPWPETGDRHADVAALTLGMNQALERWIREDPGAWLWLHRRWPKEPREGTTPP